MCIRDDTAMTMSTAPQAAAITAKSQNGPPAKALPNDAAAAAASTGTRRT